MASNSSRRPFPRTAAHGNMTARTRLTQEMPGTGGVLYALSAWCTVEADDRGSEMILGLEFLDAEATEIGGVEQDVYPSHPRDGSSIPTMIAAVSPPGTVSVRVVVETVNGSVTAAHPQSAHLDDIHLVGTQGPARPVEDPDAFTRRSTRRRPSPRRDVLFAHPGSRL